jgi:hypothetical protein
MPDRTDENRARPTMTAQRRCGTTRDYQGGCQMTANDWQVQAMRTMQRRRSVGNTFATTGGDAMFSTNHIARALAASGRAQALDAWREAANLVSTRWRR